MAWKSVTLDRKPVGEYNDEPDKRGHYRWRCHGRSGTAPTPQTARETVRKVAERAQKKR